MAKEDFNSLVFHAGEVGFDIDRRLVPEISWVRSEIRMTIEVISDKDPLNELMEFIMKVQGLCKESSLSSLTTLEDREKLEKMAKVRQLPKVERHEKFANDLSQK